MKRARPRVLICDDSRSYASALARVVGHGDELEVVGVSKTAEEVLAAIPAVEPDLVTMDLELPGISGLEAVEQIMHSHPLPILVLSSHVGPRSETAAAALAAGALEAVGKDTLDLNDPENAAAAALRRRLALLSGAHVIRHPRAGLNKRRRTPTTAARPGTKAIGICASTGGPHALAAVLGSLPAGFEIPVLVVQHMSAGFTEGLVRWLDSAVALPVRLAAAGAPVSSGVWIAPEGAHVVVDEGGYFALPRRHHGFHCPSGDVLLESLAARYRRDAVAVILTGMGRDGAEGARAVREAGGLTIAQDEATSAVFGMPQAAAALGVELVLPLDQIGAQLSALAPAEALA
ncbi:MAG TPA: chemotaxis protein CheB [Gaiellaceae bacterium]|nr:chemotaxis protein CheB [Gaiellaceae bacterium]